MFSTFTTLLFCPALLVLRRQRRHPHNDFPQARFKRTLPVLPCRPAGVFAVESQFENAVWNSLSAPLPQLPQSELSGPRRTLQVRGNRGFVDGPVLPDREKERLFVDQETGLMLEFSIDGAIQRSGSDVDVEAAIRSNRRYHSVMDRL